MRIRSIKPEFWRSEDISNLPLEVRLLFIGLWSYVDDNGVGIDDHRHIAADLFALDDDPSQARAFVREGLARLTGHFLIDRYTVGGRHLIFISGWDKHQRIDKPAKPRFPRPGDATGTVTRGNADSTVDDATPSRGCRESVAPGTGEQGNRGTVKQQTSSVVVPRKRGTRIPDDFTVTPDMVAWAKDRAPNIDGRRETEKFVNYWRAKSGANATKLDWPATWRNWIMRAGENAPAAARNHAGLVEREGMWLTPENAANYDRTARLVAADRAAIEGAA